MSKDSLTITDNRTGRNYELSIQNGTIRSTDLRQIKVSEGDFGLMGYDPAFVNTGSCQSKITFVDGEKGVLLYRGDPIEELAEKSTYLETAYLILLGELRDEVEVKQWAHDPRAKIIKQVADQVFEVTGRNPLLDIALELERIALQDDYFIKRKLYPNVDFYSGIIYQSMGLPMDMFPVLFAIPRTSGWIAQWEEMLTDQDQKLARPKQVYLGAAERDYVPMDKRK